ncbi:putative phosphoenolpyruvate synthase-like protein, partial [Leptotrombidium deliense]
KNKGTFLSIFGHDVENVDFAKPRDSRVNPKGKHMAELKASFGFLSESFISGTRVKGSMKNIGKFKLINEQQKFETAAELFNYITNSMRYYYEVGLRHGECTNASISATSAVMELLTQKSDEGNAYLLQDFSILLSQNKGVISAEIPKEMKAIADWIGDEETFLLMNESEALNYLEKGDTRASVLFNEFIAQHGHRGYKEADIYIHHEFAALRSAQNSNATNADQTSGGASGGLRKVYSSELLLNLRNQKCCIHKPDTLPQNLEIVLEQSHYRFNENEEYKPLYGENESFKEYLRVLIDRGFTDTQFCGTFCQNIIAVESSNARAYGFKQYLNTHLQLEFEKLIYTSYDIEGKEREAEEAGDVRLKERLLSDVSLSKHWFRVKLGVAMLVGELYRLSILQFNVVKGFIETLLLIGDNESLQCIYYILKPTVPKLRKDCADYTEKRGVETDLFTFYICKLQQYFEMDYLNKTNQLKLKKLFDVIEGKENTAPAKAENGGGEGVNTSG